MTFELAGDDADLHAAYVERQIDDRRRVGEQLLGEAQDLVHGGSSQENLSRAEVLARQGLERLARSLDWAEDEPREVECHHRLDAAGRFVRETFGCDIEYDGTQYFETCPVALAHNRLGMSIGGTARRICSLCGRDVADCDHSRGQAYLVPGGHEDLGWCRVCLVRQACEHLPSRLYRTGLVSIVTELTVDEVSLVTKPANPEARLTKVSIDTAELLEALGAEFEVGMPVSCDKCLTSCRGLIKHDVPMHG